MGTTINTDRDISEMTNNTPHHIGLLGGTFDPIHIGHLKLASMVLEHCELDCIHFIPNKIPPHRATPLVSSKQRLAMVQLAIRDFSRFIASDLEISRPGPSYTFDTLSSLQRLYPQDHFYLLLGMDVFKQFNSWHRWQDILSLCHLILISRPGHPLPSAPWCNTLLSAHQATHHHQLRARQAGYIYWQKIPPIPITATTIREQLATDPQMQTLLPHDVYAYIKTHHLYGC